MTERAEMTNDDAEALLRAEMKRERKKLERRVSLPPRAKTRLVRCFEAEWLRVLGLSLG